MKRLYFSILICVFAVKQEMDALFVSMPDSNIPQLENAWRKDLTIQSRSLFENTMNERS